MNISHEITSTVCLSSGDIRIDETVTNSAGHIDAALVSYYNRVIATKDDLTHAALVALGWTPPLATRAAH